MHARLMGKKSIRAIASCRDVDLPNHPAGHPALDTYRPVALRRGSEVLLGAMVGWIIHWGAEVVLDALENRALSLRMRTGNGRGIRPDRTEG
jgi:hypothetical protein